MRRASRVGSARCVWRPTVVKSARFTLIANRPRAAVVEVELLRELLRLVAQQLDQARSRRARRIRRSLRWRSTWFRARARRGAGRFRAPGRAPRATTNRRARAAAHRRGGADLPIVAMPKTLKRACVFGPIPQRRATGIGARKAASSPGATASRPSGLHESEAIFAIIFPVATPALTVSRVASRTSPANRGRELARSVERRHADGDEGFVERKPLDLAALARERSRRPRATPRGTSASPAGRRRGPGRPCALCRAASPSARRTGAPRTTPSARRRGGWSRRSRPVCRAAQDRREPRRSRRTRRCRSER